MPQQKANSGVYNASPVYVQAGKVVHCIISLVPTALETINPVQMKKLKVDFKDVLTEDPLLCFDILCIIITYSLPGMVISQE